MVSDSPVSRPAVSDRVVGRQGELALLGQVLQDASAGRPRVACVEGAAGVGKSTLLSSFRGRLTGVQQLYASGDERETVLQFGVIDQLRRHLQAAGLEVEPVLAGQGTREPDTFMVGLDLLEAIGDLEDSGTVLVTIDDAHWADAASLQAIAFAFRRLRADRVMVLLSVREGCVADLPDTLQRLVLADPGNRIFLSGLSPTEVGLLAEQRGWSLSLETAERLHAHTGGNPLYVKAVLEEVEPAALDRLESPLPAPRSFRQIIRTRLERCSTPTNALLEAAAVLGRRSEMDQLLQLVTLADPLRALDEAVAAGLLEQRSDPPRIEVEFHHPLISSAVYHQIPLDRRALLHQRAALVVNDELLALRHELAAAHATDADLAARFEAYGRRQLARGSYNPAAFALRAAAQLSSERRDQERLVLDALDCDLHAGRSDAAIDLTGFERTAQHHFVLARMAQVAGRPFEAEPLFKLAWEARGSGATGDDELSWRIASWYAEVLVNAGKPRDAGQWCQRALEAMTPDRRASSFAMACLLMSLASQGEAAEALRRVSALPSDPSTISSDGLEQLFGRGVARLWSDQVADARRDLARATELARQRAATDLIATALAFLSDAEYRLGDWDAATLHGELAVSTAHDLHWISRAGLAHAIAAFPHIGRGAWPQAEQHIEQAQRIALEAGNLATMGYAAVAGARLALTRQRWDDAVAALAPIAELELEPANEPGVMAWQLMYVEGLIRQGRVGTAGEWLDRAEARIRERGIRSQLPTVAWLRAGLKAQAGNLGAGLAVFARSAADELPAAGPLERARFELEYGSLLRRLKRRRAARLQLESARQRLQVLRAEPLLARCEAELAGAGLRPVHRTRDDRHLLTSQELAVARLVADGLTNRKVASQLFISPRTVDYHLGHVYGKLGLTSRSQLARQFAGASGPAG